MAVYGRNKEKAKSKKAKNKKALIYKLIKRTRADEIAWFGDSGSAACSYWLVLVRVVVAAK